MPAKKRLQLSREEALLQRLVDRTNPDYDREHQKRLRSNLDVIRASKAKSDVALWDEGDAFATIEDLKLFLQLGFNGMKPFVEQGLGRSMSWVRTLITFASTYPRGLVESHGRKKIGLGEQYASLTLTKTDGASLEALLLKVPARGEGEKLAEIPFARASESDVELAIEHQRKLAADRAASALSVEQRALIEHCERLVQEELTKLGRAGQGGFRAQPSADGDPDKAIAHLAVPLPVLVRILKRLVKER